MIFVSLTPDASIDLEDYLGGMLPELESFGFERWHMYKQNELPTSNWKVAHDGYLEGYHFAILHPKTIAQQVMTNIMTYDSFGPHQRVGFPTHKITELRNKPQQEWETEEGITVVRTVFPNAVICDLGETRRNGIATFSRTDSRQVAHHPKPHLPETASHE